MSALPAVMEHQQLGDKYDQREMIEVIKNTVCKGASDAQLKMFIEVARTTGLNPFLKEIYFVAEKGIIMAGRDGYLRVANENPNFDGMETRVDRDEKNVPIKATCTVWRKDRGHPIIAEAYYSEYKKASPVWSQYPSAMIGKVAEVLALKRSFSINGVVTEEEIGFDGAGSAEAAKAVAEEKLRRLRGGERATTIDAEFDQRHPKEDAIDAEPVDEAAEIRRDAEQVEATAKRKPKTKRYDILQAFGALKKRYRDAGRPEAYHQVLESNGVQHSDEFPDTDEGLAKARVAYKLMSLSVAEIEALIAIRDCATWEEAMESGAKRIRLAGVEYDYDEAFGNYKAAEAKAEKPAKKGK